MDVASSLADLSDFRAGTAVNTSSTDTSVDMKEQRSDDFINEAAMKTFPASETIVTEQKSSAIDPRIQETLTYELEQLKEENSRLQGSLERDNLKMLSLLESEVNNSR